MQRLLVENDALRHIVHLLERNAPTTIESLMAENLAMQRLIGVLEGHHHSAAPRKKDPIAHLLQVCAAGVELPVIHEATAISVLRRWRNVEATALQYDAHYMASEVALSKDPSRNVHMWEAFLQAMQDRPRHAEHAGGSALGGETHVRNYARAKQASGIDLGALMQASFRENGIRCDAEQAAFAGRQWMAFAGKVYERTRKMPDAAALAARFAVRGGGRAEALAVWRHFVNGLEPVRKKRTPVVDPLPPHLTEDDDDDYDSGSY